MMVVSSVSAARAQQKIKRRTRKPVRNRDAKVPKTIEISWR